MGTDRETTKQEMIIDSMYQNLRVLDKLTWFTYANVRDRQADLIEEAELLRSNVNRYINKINELSSMKKVE